jgi:hypothetical protein
MGTDSARQKHKLLQHPSLRSRAGSGTKTRRHKEWCGFDSGTMNDPIQWLERFGALESRFGIGPSNIGISFVVLVVFVFQQFCWAL